MKTAQTHHLSKPFIYLLFLHLGFKLILGIQISTESHFTPFLAIPPLPLLISGSDIFLVCILSIPLIYLKGLIKKIATATIIGCSSFYLFYSLFVYQYFKGFNNWGLIAFLGTDVEDAGIGSYLLQKLNIYLLLFAILIILSAFIAFKPPRFLKQLNRKVFLTLFLFALISTAVSHFLPLSLTAGLQQNPELTLVYSFIKQDRDAIPNRTIKNFSPPKAPLYGTYNNRGYFSPTPPEKPMNILLLTLESLPYKRTSLANTKPSNLTIIDELKPHSIWFHNYRTPFPNTTRALISLNCSQYPGILHHSLTQYNPNFTCTSLPGELKKRGYTTAYFTASSLSFDAIDKAPFMRDFDVVEGKKKILSFYTSQQKQGIHAIEEELVLKRIDHFLQQKESYKPFYLHYFLFWTHNPHELPFEDIAHLPIEERFQKSLAYENAVIKKLLTMLRQHNLFDNTLIIITADHGEAFGEHPLNWVHANFLYDELLKIPLVIYTPKLIDRHIDIYRNSSHIDFAPLLFSLLGETPPPSWKGENSLSSTYHPKPLLIFTRAMRIFNGIIDGNNKYIYNPRNGREEFYNLAKDPAEQDNIIDSMPQTVTESYKEIIEKWLIYNQNNYIEATHD